MERTEPTLSAISPIPMTVVAQATGRRLIRVWIDGACPFNGNREVARMGIGLWFGEGSPHNVAAPLVLPPPTSNRAELGAFLAALHAARRHDVAVMTDSSLVARGATEWLPGWKRAGWRRADGKGVANTDMWRLVDAELAGRKASGCSTDVKLVPRERNAGADKLARMGAQMANNR